MPTAKKNQGQITQSQLKQLYQQQQEAAEARRLALAKAEQATTAATTLGTLKNASIEEGPYKARRTEIRRRVPHYKQETYDLAAKLGKDPDAYLEECRNRGTVIKYWRLKLIVE